MFSGWKWETFLNATNGTSVRFHLRQNAPNFAIIYAHVLFFRLTYYSYTVYVLLQRHSTQLSNIKT